MCVCVCVLFFVDLCVSLRVCLWWCVWAGVCIYICVCVRLFVCRYSCVGLMGLQWSMSCMLSVSVVLCIVLGTSVMFVCSCACCLLDYSLAVRVLWQMCLRFILFGVSVCGCCSFWVCRGFVCVYVFV